MIKVPISLEGTQTSDVLQVMLDGGHLNLPGIGHTGGYMLNCWIYGDLVSLDVYSTVMPRYNTFVGRHLWDRLVGKALYGISPVDFRHCYPKSTRYQTSQGWKFNLSFFDHSFRNIQSPCSGGLIYIQSHRN